MRARTAVRFAAFAALAVAFGAGRLGAQTCTTTNITNATAKTCTSSTNTSTASTMTNPKLLQLTVSPTVSSFTATTAMMTAGHADALPVALTVTGNRTWTLSVSGGAWTGTGTYAWKSKPLSDLKYSSTLAGAQTVVTTSATQVASGTASAAVNSTLYFWVLLAWTKDAPGSYAVPVTFTLTAP